MADSNPPPLFIPRGFIEESAYFKELHNFLYLLWQRSGGGSDNFVTLEIDIDNSVEIINQDIDSFRYASIAAAALEDHSTRDYVSTISYHASLDEGSAHYVRDNTTGTPSTIYANRAGFYDSNGAGFSLSGDAVSIYQFGAYGDGVTNDYDALVHALAYASGKTLLIPAGTFRLSFSATNAFGPPADTYIQGAGKGLSILSIQPDSTVFRNIFNCNNDGLTIKDIGIDAVIPSTGSFTLFRLVNNKVHIENCDLDGAASHVGASISHDAFCFGFPGSTTQEDIHVENCDIHNWSFGILKANSSTSTQRRLSFVNNDFYLNYNDNLQFNSPNGTMEDVLVHGNVFRDSQGEDASLTEPLYCSFASVSNFVVSDNIFHGEILDAIHLEEDCLYGTITGNIISVDGNAITLDDNDNGGTDEMPQYITICDNIVKKEGTAKESGLHGIQLITDASPEVPGKNVIIANNVIDSFDLGIVTDAEMGDGCVIRGNEINNCTEGIREAFLSADVVGNTTRNCGTGYKSTYSGTLRDHTFIDCTTNIDATSRPVLVINPTFTLSEFAITGGVTEIKSFFDLGTNDRMYGIWSYNALTDGGSSDFALETFEITWDGTTYTATSKTTYQPGGFAVDVNMTGTTMDMRFFDADDRNVRFTATFTGSIAVAV